MDSTSSNGRKLTHVFLSGGKHPTENVLPGGEPEEPVQHGERMGERFGTTSCLESNEVLLAARV
jgi:hypothetical protein